MYAYIYYANDTKNDIVISLRCQLYKTSRHTTDLSECYWICHCWLEIYFILEKPCRIPGRFRFAVPYNMERTGGKKSFGVNVWIKFLSVVDQRQHKLGMPNSVTMATSHLQAAHSLRHTWPNLYSIVTQETFILNITVDIWSLPYCWCVCTTVL